MQQLAGCYRQDNQSIAASVSVFERTVPEFCFMNYVHSNSGSLNSLSLFALVLSSQEHSSVPLQNKHVLSSTHIDCLQ